MVYLPHSGSQTAQTSSHRVVWRVPLNYDLSARRRVFSAFPSRSYLCHITNYVFPMAKELTDILKAAAVVRDETVAEEYRNPSGQRTC